MCEKREAKMDTKAQTKAVLQLGKHLRSNCDKILDKSILFVVDSALLWFIGEAIQSVLSKEATLFPEDNNAFEDYVLFLADFFEQTPSLCISLSESPKGVSSIPGNLDLAHFRSLHFLELRKIPPHMVINFHGIKTKLKKLKCSRCLDSVNEILSSQQQQTTGSSNNNSINNNQDSVPSSSTIVVAPSSLNLVWPELKDIDLSFNRISEIDSTVTANFQLTPSVEVLNLSRNRIFSVDDSFCHVLNSLRVLNLNYNQLKRIPPVPPNVKTLLLSHNYITSLTSAAFKSLRNVEVLDLSTNMISDENEFDALSELTHLKSVSLLGNPVSFLENYRHSVCSNLNRLVLNRMFLLDNKKLSVSEVRRALEAMKYHKFVPFTVEDEDAISSQMTASTPSLRINNMKSLTQSYDSTSSSVRSSCRKKAKIREPHVFDPDEESETLEMGQDDAVSVKTVRTQSIESGDVKERNSDGSSDSSEIAVVTRNAIEQLREKYGPENWLLKQAGMEVSKLFKIPVATPKPSSPAPILSQSLPNALNKSASAASFYTTATEFDETKLLEIGNENSSSSATISPMPADNDSSSNAITDDSLVYYPCDSTAAEEWGSAVSNNVVPDGGRAVTSSASDTFPSYSPEIFIDSTGNAVEFHYFQSGQMHKLVILENYLYEVERDTAAVIHKWDLRGLETLTDEKFTKETDTVEFKVVFDTMRKNLRERTFVMTEKDYTKFYETVEPFLELKIMQDFADAFQCLKCNAQFSKAMADKTVCSDADGRVKEIPICNNPECRSEMLVLLDSAPLPNNKSLNVEKELEQFGGMNRGSSPLAGECSSIAKPVEDSKLFRVPLASSTPKVDSDGFPHNTAEWDFIDRRTSVGVIATATTVVSSKEYKSSSEPASLNVTNTKSDSDIETLSCNSSSIEVLGTNGGDSGSNSDIVDVPEAVELATDGNQKHKVTVAMTDSTSSGSCAESVCTAYEKRAGANGPNQSQNSPSGISNANSSFSSTGGSSTLTLMATSTQSVSPRHGMLCAPVKYDYEDFSKVDHRLQLFCEISVFKKSDERLLALAKVLVISEASPYSALVIFSNKKMYIYKIVGLEGDKPDNWLQKVKSFSLEKLSCLNVLIGRHGIGVEMQGKGYYALIFKDSQRTSSFLECFLGDICAEMECPPLVRDFSHTHKALLSTDEVVYFGVLQYASCENEKTHTSAVVVTNQEILFITDLGWMGATRQGNVVTAKSQKLSSLRQVESHANNESFVKLIFGTTNHVFWDLYFDSVNEKQLFVTNLNAYTKGVPFISLYQPIEP